MYLLTRQCILCKEAPYVTWNSTQYLLAIKQDTGFLYCVMERESGRENSQRWKSYEAAATEICLLTVHGMQRIYMAVAQQPFQREIKERTSRGYLILPISQECRLQRLVICISVSKSLQKRIVQIQLAFTFRVWQDQFLTPNFQIQRIF